MGRTLGRGGDGQAASSQARFRLPWLSLTLSRSHGDPRRVGVWRASPRVRRRCSTGCCKSRAPCASSVTVRGGSSPRRDGCLFMARWVSPRRWLGRPCPSSGQWISRWVRRYWCFLAERSSDTWFCGLYSQRSCGHGLAWGGGSFSSAPATMDPPSPFSWRRANQAFVGSSGSRPDPCGPRRLAGWHGFFGCPLRFCCSVTGGSHGFRKRESSSTTGSRSGFLPAGCSCTGSAGIEMAVALAVCFWPSRFLLLGIGTWKIASELLYPISGRLRDTWEWVERGGDYLCPLALLAVLALLDRHTASDSVTAGRAVATPETAPTPYPSGLHR